MSAFSNVAKTTAHVKGETHAVITTPSGKTYDLGRVDNKWWAPRAWYYRFVIYPRRKRQES